MTIVFIKELKSYIKSYKYFIAMICSLLLIIFATFCGIKDYSARLGEYHTLINQNRDQINNSRVFSEVSPKAIKEPSKLSVFCRGIEKYSPVVYETNMRQPLTPVLGINVEDKLSQIVADIDMFKIIGIFLSLFSLFFGYEVICKEVEAGTLKMVLSTGISKSKYLLAKILSSLVALLSILVICFITAIMLIVITLPDFIDFSFLLTFFSFFFISICYLSVFYLIGVLFSIIASNSSEALLSCTIVWTIVIFIYPITLKTIVSLAKPIPESFYVSKDNQINTIKEPIYKFKVSFAGNASIDYVKGIYKVHYFGDTTQYINFRDFVITSEKTRQAVNEEIDNIDNDIFNKECDNIITYKNFAIPNPYLLFQSISEDLCKTSIINTIDFKNRSKDYKNEISSYWNRKKAIESYNYFSPIKNLNEFESTIIPLWTKIMTDRKNENKPLPSDMTIYPSLNLKDFPIFQHSSSFPHGVFLTITINIIVLIIIGVFILLMSLHVINKKII